jgi:serine protease Do
MSNHDETSGILERIYRKLAKIKSTLLVIVITSLISGVTVGGLLSLNYRAEYKRQLQGLGNPGIFKAGFPVSYTPIAQIAKKTGPSIVGIRMAVTTHRNQFFNLDGEQSTIEGSGIIISKDGYIMTNYHVVQYADPRNANRRKVTLEVFLPDKRQAQAKFIGGDALNDLAVIRIDLKDLPVADLGNSSRLEVGELAVAIGNPLGLEFAGSVTSGVISALNRTVSIEDRTLNLIQTDAAINPGNSGGALVNSEGKVIGINTIKISVSGVEGLGFAIPVNDAKPIVNQLIKYGYVKGRPFIGISGQDISEAMARYYDLPVGVFIVAVSADSGAAKAGIRKKDIMISLAGKTVTTMQEVNQIKRAYKAGDTVNTVFVRGKRKLNIKLTFSEEH